MSPEEPIIRIGTRRSALAMAQSGQIAHALGTLRDGLVVNMESIRTSGDAMQKGPLREAGGKGLFVKEIQQALLEGRIDLAVHSMKDYPVAGNPDDLMIAVVPAREAVEDVWLSRKYDTLSKLPKGATVGTSSLRRKAQLLKAFPHLRIIDLRGNIDTRVKRMEQGDFDGILLARAGLNRLQLQNKITAVLSVDEILPCAGQGALCVETSRYAKPELLELLRNLHCHKTAFEVETERACLSELGADCNVPVGVHAKVSGEYLMLRAGLWSLDGKSALIENLHCKAEDASSAGREIGKKLLNGGGRNILETKNQ